MRDASNTDVITTPFGSLYYDRYGSGPKTLLVFHGFGQDHTIALELLKALQNDYTVFSFDLPYHGKSKWSENEQPITKGAIQEIFHEWLKTEDIDNFSVLGYSMGGKFALSISERFVQQIKHCILIAPDGLYKSPWYSIVTSLPLKALFKHIIYHPNLFVGLTKFVSLIRIIPFKLIQFAQSQMATSEHRKQVYYTWINLKKLYLSKQHLQQLVNENDFKINLILGDKDSVIKPQMIIPFVEGIKTINVTVFPVGHGRLFSECIPLLTELLRKEDE